MAKSKKKAEVVFLVCDETGDLNYILRRKPGGEKLKLSKYSPRLQAHDALGEEEVVVPSGADILVCGEQNCLVGRLWSSA